MGTQVQGVGNRVGSEFNLKLCEFFNQLSDFLYFLCIIF